MDERLAFCEKLEKQMEWIEEPLTDYCDQIGLVDDVKNCESLEKRLALFEKICKRFEWAACGLTGKDFEKLGFIEDINALEEKERIPWCKKLMGVSTWVSVGVANNFDQFDFKGLEIKERVSLLKEIALQNRLAAEALVEYFDKIGLDQMKISDRMALCRLIAGHDEYVTGKLIEKIDNLGDDHEKRQIVFELLIPPNNLNQKCKELKCVTDVKPLISILLKKEEDLMSPSEIKELEKFPTVKPFVEDIRKIKDERARQQVSQWAAYCACAMENQTEVNTSDLLKDIFKFRNPPVRYAFTKHLSLMNPNDLKKFPSEANKKKWSGLSWVLVSRMKDIGFSDEQALDLLKKINGKKHFQDPKRFNHLVQLLLKVIEEGPYNEDEVKLIDDKLTAILTKKGQKNVRVLISRDLQTLTNIFNIFGKEEFIKCLNPEIDIHDFFLEKFQELFAVEGVEDLSDRYQATFGNFRDPMALFTYLRSVRKLPQPDRGEVEGALREYVNAVLKGEFPEIRYDIKNSEHLEKLFAQDGDLKRVWLEQAEETKTIKGSGKKQKINYKKKFHETFRDGHLSKSDYPLLSSYLDGKYPKVDEKSEDPNILFQSLAMKLCKGKITPEKFVDEVGKLNLNLGEDFLNDLHTFIPKKGFKEYTISESDDPCDLILIGTEIYGSCQRVNGTPQLNKCLVSYLMNGEIRPIVVKAGKKLVARSLLRLAWDEKNQTPVLLQERLYSNVEDDAVKQALKDWAEKKAEKMGIPLVSVEVGGGEPYDGSVECFQGYAPYVYSDAVRGAMSGPFEIKDSKVRFKPE